MLEHHGWWIKFQVVLLVPNVNFEAVARNWTATVQGKRELSDLDSDPGAVALCCYKGRLGGWYAWFCSPENGGVSG